MIPEVILRVDWLQTHCLFIMSMPKNIGIVCEISTLNQYILELFWVAFCHTDNRPTPDRMAHTTAFGTPVVEHWLERELA